MKRGFTLIELLVVIAIIAILAAILFPVFAQAREKARAITCVSNEKQIGLGVMMYTQDFDETFPLQQFTNNDANNVWVFYTWQTAVDPYMKSTNVYKCPSNPWSAYPISGGLSPYPISYAVSGALFPNYGDGFVTALSQIQEPDSTIVACESRAPWASLSANNIIWDRPSGDVGDYAAGTPLPAGNQGDAMEHFHFINMVFSDGHVKPMPFASTVYPYDMWLTQYVCNKQTNALWYYPWSCSPGALEYEVTAGGDLLQEYNP